jgi:hypothetical protein
MSNCCNTSQTPGCSSDSGLSVSVLISTKAIEVQLDSLYVVLNDLQVALAGLCQDEGDYLQLISGVLSDIITADNACCNLLAGKLERLKTTIRDSVNICGEYTTTTTVALCGINGSAECDGTTVIITIVAGEDVGTPLNLYYWNLSTLAWVSMGAIPKALLEAGYTVTIPPTTTKYKIVDELGACGTIEEIPFTIECTTSTTEEMVTTTSEEPSTTTSEEPSTTTSEEPTTTTTALCVDYKCGDGLIEETYYPDGYFIHPEVLVCGDSAICNIFHWETIDRPNRFRAYDDSSPDFIYDSEWKGQANYPGPWGLTLNTAISGDDPLVWGSTTGRKVIVETGPGDPLNPTVDLYRWRLNCAECGGD